MAKKNKKNNEYKTLLSVLANGSTDKANAILKKYSGQTATNTKDLEIKLARTYAVSPSKIDIEKDFADIHPHKEFILKYNLPKVVEVKAEKKEPAPQNNYTNLPDSTTTIKLEPKSNADGCNCPLCSGQYSNLNGDAVKQNQQVDKNTVFGFVSIVAILGMVLYFSNKK